MGPSNHGARALRALVYAVCALAVGCASPEQCEPGAEGDRDCERILEVAAAICELGTCRVVHTSTGAKPSAETAEASDTEEPTQDPTREPDRDAAADLEPDAGS